MPEQAPADLSGLPETVAIMVVDTKGFSAHNDVQQDELSPLIPQVLEQACLRCGLEDLWSSRLFPDSTGDGYLIGFPPSLLPRVVDRYFEALQEELMAERRRLAARGIRLRMRLSLHLGPARRLDDPRVGSPVGNAMIDTHRLVDVEALRVLLEKSDPDVTLLAVALSDRVMADVFNSGRTSRRAASEFVGVPVAIARKGFAATAHLHVPAPSGDVLRHGLLGVQSTPDGNERGEPDPDQARPVPPQRSTGGVRTVSGNSGVVAGGNVDQSSRTSTVQGDQYTAQRDISVTRERRPKR